MAAFLAQIACVWYAWYALLEAICLSLPSLPVFHCVGLLDLFQFCNRQPLYLRVHLSIVLFLAYFLNMSTIICENNKLIQ